MAETSNPVKFFPGVLPYKLPGYDDLQFSGGSTLDPKELSAPLPIANTDEFVTYLPVRTGSSGGTVFTDDFGRSDGSVGNGWHTFAAEVWVTSIVGPGFSGTGISTWGAEDDVAPAIHGGQVTFQRADLIVPDLPALPSGHGAMSYVHSSADEQPTGFSLFRSVSSPISAVELDFTVDLPDHASSTDSGVTCLLFVADVEITDNVETDTWGGDFDPPYDSSANAFKIVSKSFAVGSSPKGMIFAITVTKTACFFSLFRSDFGITGTSVGTYTGPYHSGWGSETPTVTLKVDKDGDVYSGYVNGVKVMTLTDTGATVEWDSIHTVGVQVTGGGPTTILGEPSFFMGTIDSFALYSGVGPDVFAINRTKVSASGGLSTVWSKQHSLDTSEGGLQALASCATDNRLITLLSHKLGTADPVLRLHSYDLATGEAIDDLEFTPIHQDSLGMSLFAYNNSAAWLFWADDDFKLHAQTVEISGSGMLTLGRTVILDSGAAKKDPRFVQELKAGRCALYSRVEGDTGSVYEIKDSGGQAVVVSQVSGVGSGDGTFTQFAATETGLALAMHEASDFLWGTIDWADGPGLANWQFSTDDTNSPTVDTSSDPLASGLCPPNALGKQYLYYAYMKDASVNRPWQMIVDLFDFATLPASLAPTWPASALVPNGAAVASAVSDKFDMNLAPVSENPLSHDPLEGPGHVRFGVVGDDAWLITQWLAVDGPYVLVVSADLKPPSLTAQPRTRTTLFS